MAEEDTMNDAKELLLELKRFTPKNWAVRDQRGRTVVVVQATTAKVAIRRLPLLRAEWPKFPARVTVRQHHGPVRCAWFGDGWFHLREECERMAQRP